MAEDDDLARERTDWAEDRTILANERTFAAWIRTALATAAVGIGLHAVFGATNPTWLAKAVATLFQLIAIGIVLSCRGGAQTTLERLAHHDSAPASDRTLARVSWLMTVAFAMTIVVLWLS